ncbi:expressed unknown protein [Seminavis robusta]|uniref:Uncharacterized protein n=1 Tax=Seminavis robusta TaxID=568900 RepID=A0A9N8DE71_9STRA|nr:expressed unknown protein [Seminavis robusta]|eukprot:Sro107_g053790.1 n/a (381) ;mRNA; f:32320-33462
MVVEVERSCPAGMLQKLTSWLATRASLLTIRISIFQGETETIRAICEALKTSVCLQCVGLTLRADDNDVSLAARKSLQNLIENCGAIQHLTIGMTYSVFRSIAAPPRPTTDYLESFLFDGLINTKLATFAYWGPNVVRVQNKEKAWRAMEQNNNLKRIVAEFGDYRTDSHLPLLEANKCCGWIKEWTSTSTANGRPQQHGSILQQVLDFPTLSNFPDKLPLLYHFLRERPDVPLGRAEEVIAAVGANPVRPWPTDCKMSKRTVTARSRGKKKKQPLQWYHCWGCQTHLYGDERALKQHQEQSKRHKHEKKKKKKKSRQHKKRPTNHGVPRHVKLPVIHHCWCCRTSFIAEDHWKEHLNSKGHRRGLNHAAPSPNQQEAND